MTGLLLGCVADDVTGATDLASMLSRHGMRTVQRFGAPQAGTPVPDASFSARSGWAYGMCSR